MSTHSAITPRDLFLEFSALESESSSHEHVLARQAYSVAVDLVDGLTKGEVKTEWNRIYRHLKEAFISNRDRAIGYRTSPEEVQAWNVAIETMEIAIETLSVDSEGESATTNDEDTEYQRMWDEVGGDHEKFIRALESKASPEEVQAWNAALDKLANDIAMLERRQ